MPGVAKAAASTDTPLSRASQAPLLFKAERVRNAVGPGWFATYGTRFLAGRDFSDQDSASGPPVAIVNQAFARKFFPDKNPLGLLIEARTIVGIVDDAVFATVRNGVRPTLYTPLAQSGGSGPPGRTDVAISIRIADGPAAPLTRSVSAALTAVDPGLAFSFRPLQEFVDASVSQERILSGLAGLFGGLALLLTGLGLYGVTSYAVNRRAVRDRDQDGPRRSACPRAHSRPWQEPRDHGCWSHPRTRCRRDGDTVSGGPAIWRGSARSADVRGCGVRACRRGNDRCVDSRSSGNPNRSFGGAAVPSKRAPSD